MPPVSTSDIQELIQTTIQRILVEPLEQASTFLSLGARVFDTSAPISIPTLSGDFTPSWVGENELIPEADGVEFDSIGLLPSTMKSVKSLVRISNESLRQSILSLDSVLQARLVKDVSAQIDAQAWSAAGDGVTTPRGVLAPANVAGFADVPVDGPITLDHLHDAYGQALADDVPLSGLRWVMSPQMLTSLRKVKDGTQRYIVTSDLASTPGGLSLLGVPVTLTKRFPASGDGEPVLLMSPSTWAVARDLSPQVVVLRERWAEYDQTGLRVVTRWDWKPLQPEANVILTGAEPAAA